MSLLSLLQAGSIVRVRGKFWRWCRRAKVTFRHFSSRDGSSATKIFPNSHKWAPRGLLRLLFWKTNKPGAHGLTHGFKPTAWPAPHACAHLYDLGMGWGNHGQLFRHGIAVRPLNGLSRAAYFLWPLNDKYNVSVEPFVVRKCLLPNK